MAHDLPASRLAEIEDRSAILEHAHMIHEEIGLFPLEEAKLLELIDGYYSKKAWISIAVVGDGRVEGSICTSVSTTYYTNAQHVAEMWNYVHPDYRRSRNAEALIHFGFDLSKKLSAKMGQRLPFIAGILTNKNTAAKVRLYKRMFGAPVGAYFVYNSDWDIGPPMENMVDLADLRRRLRKYSDECTSLSKEIPAHRIRKEIAPMLAEAAEVIRGFEELWEVNKTNGAAERIG